MRLLFSLALQTQVELDRAAENVVDPLGAG